MRGIEDLDFKFNEEVWQDLLRSWPPEVADFARKHRPDRAYMLPTGVVAVLVTYELRNGQVTAVAVVMQELNAHRRVEEDFQVFGLRSEDLYPIPAESMTAEKIADLAASLPSVAQLDEIAQTLEEALFGKPN